MPELPEVEVTRRGIAAPLLGARVLSVRLGKPLRWPLGQPLQTLVGRRIGEITRRGKYLWLPLQAPDAVARGDGAGCTDGGGCAKGAGETRGGEDAAYRDASDASDASNASDGSNRSNGSSGSDGSDRTDGGLLLHLGMSGSLSLQRQPQPPGPHDHFDLATDCGTLRLNDPRRFGAVVWSPSLLHAPAATLLKRLGAEPFDAALTPVHFHAALQQRRAPIKAVLLAGDVVVGAGNIYACEALFLAGVHPALRADRISRPRAARLLAALRQTLSRALELGGSTLRDFSDVHGTSGAFQSEAAVYGRAGLPCTRCGGLLKRQVQAQRSTYFCVVCQRR